MPSVKSLNKNTHQIRIYCGRDESKKPIRHIETFKGTKKQAWAYACNLEEKIKEKKGSLSGIQNLWELFEKWKDELDRRFQKNLIEEYTLEQYKLHINKMQELMGDLKAYKLDPSEIEIRLEELFNQGLAMRTIKNYYRSLKTALNWGVKKNYISENIPKSIEPPEVKHVIRPVLNSIQLELLLKEAQGFKHYLELRIIALTGLRVGELMGLKWKYVFLDNHLIQIVQAINSKTNNLKDTKTSNSHRVLELDEETINLLREHKKYMSRQNLAYDNDFVFKSDEKNFVRYAVIHRTLKRALKKAGLHQIRIHDLRHGVGSILLDEGMSITATAEMLGDVPATIAQTYGHSLRRGKSIASLLSKN